MRSPEALASSAVGTGTAGDGHLLFVDGIRASAIVSVVLLHVSAPLVVQFQTLDRGWWWVANVVDSFARPCVPLFFMVSGLLLLDPAKQERLAEFFRKRFVRVMVPFFAWAAIYFAWRAFFHGESLTAEAMLRELYEGPVYVHFWFVYVLLGLYLATPILRPYVRSAVPSQLLYFLLLWGATACLLPTLYRFTGLQVGIGLVVTTGFVGYFVLGHYLRDWRLPGRGRVPAAMILAGLVALTACGTYALTSRGDGAIDEFFYGNLSPNVIAMSVCAFLLLQALPWERLSPRSRRIVGWVARTSFAIYLIHILVLELLHSGTLGFSLDGATLHPLFGIPVVTALTVAFCTAAALLMQRVPYLRLIVP